MTIHYRSLQDMNEVIVQNLHRIPSDIEVVAGIHRSGLMTATILAAHFNLPVIAFRTLCEADWISCGGRGFITPELQENYLAQPRNVLVVEDAINSARTMKREMETRLTERTRRHNFTTLAVYASTPKGMDSVDICFEATGSPRIFEWNWVNNVILDSSCIDMDGVVCRDPTREENDNGPRYEEFLRTVPRLRYPRRTLGWFVTSRLEKYRRLTEGWLWQNGYRYKRLVMNPAKTPQERSQIGHAPFKSKVYAESGMKLFVESSLSQARRIFGKTGRPVFCVETRELFQAEDA